MKTKLLTLRLYRDKKREWRWTLIARNGRKIAEGGEGYKRRKAMETSACLVLTGCEVPEFLLAELSEHRTDIVVQDDTLNKADGKAK